MNKYKDKTIVVIDFETTGFSPAKGDRVTEVCVLKLLNGKEIERFSSLINCGVIMPEHITKITGITQAMVDNAPHVSVIIPKVIDFIGDSILCGQNVQFDESFLIAESKLLGLSPKYKETICTKRLSQARYVGLKSYSLQPLEDHLGLKRDGQAHRAESDVLLTVKLLNKLLEVKESNALEELFN